VSTSQAVFYSVVHVKDMSKGVSYMNRVVAVLAIVMLVIGGVGWGETLNVGPDEAYNTIQAAIDEADSGLDMEELTCK